MTTELQEQREQRARTKTGNRPAPMWNVVLLDDDDHTYEYVMRMAQELFGHSHERAFRLAQTVDEHGRAICMTTHKEHAELKREQVLSFGRDPLMVRSRGPMSCEIEPVEQGA